MNRRLVPSTLVLAFCACVASAAHAAAPKGSARTMTTVSTTSVQNKLISFQLRNDSGATLTLQVGEQQITVEPGKTASIKAQEGAQVVTVNATTHVTAGAVLTTVSRVLSGNTLAVS